MDLKERLNKALAHNRTNRGVLLAAGDVVGEVDRAVKSGLAAAAGKEAEEAKIAGMQAALAEVDGLVQRLSEVLNTVQRVRRFHMDDAVDAGAGGSPSVEPFADGAGRGTPSRSEHFSAVDATLEEHLFSVNQAVQLLGTFYENPSLAAHGSAPPPAPTSDKARIVEVGPGTLTVRYSSAAGIATRTIASSDAEAMLLPFCACPHQFNRRSHTAEVDPAHGLTVRHLPPCDPPKVTVVCDCKPPTAPQAPEADGLPAPPVAASPSPSKFAQMRGLVGEGASPSPAEGADGETATPVGVDAFGSTAKSEPEAAGAGSADALFQTAKSTDATARQRDTRVSVSGHSATDLESCGLSASPMSTNSPHNVFQARPRHRAVLASAAAAPATPPEQAPVWRTDPAPAAYTTAVKQRRRSSMATASMAARTENLRHGRPVAWQQTLESVHSLRALDQQRVTRLAEYLKAGALSEASALLKAMCVRNELAAAYSVLDGAQTLLHIAAACGATGCKEGEAFVKTIAHARLVNHVDVSGATPLHVAVKHDNLNVADALLDAGAHIDVSDAQGRTPLMIAATSQAFMTQRGFDTLRRLSSRAVAERRSAAGLTAVHYAVAGDQPEIAAWLTKMPTSGRCRWEARDAEGRTARDLVMMKKHHLVHWVSVLFQWKADHDVLKTLVSPQMFEQALRVARNRHKHAPWEPSFWMPAQCYCFEPAARVGPSAQFQHVSAAQATPERPPVAAPAAP
eukprot:TRINITY_DN10713_c0_g3_i3.p1 TRINITY_DN10713_c0_g3~~TRINITY_DN10713_c0_g3_i3.p1  ORF type:complete len:770 (+),score=182.24 TRINITY_DN10713_c0_g3_i3:95-2311(+)